MSRRPSHLARLLAILLVAGAVAIGCQASASPSGTPSAEQATSSVQEQEQSPWDAIFNGFLPWQPGSAQDEAADESDASQEDATPQHAAALGMLAEHTRYASLTDTEKTVYDAILSGLRDHDDAISFSSSGVDTDRLGDILYDVLFDNPDIFWASSSASWELSGGTLVLHPVYFYGRADAEAMQASIDATVEDIMANSLAGADTDAEKALALSKWIADNTTYNDEDADAEQNIDSVFSGHVSVCAGYSKALSYLLTKCGIDSLVITGNATNSDGVAAAHAWVLAELDGMLTYLEPTWMDSDGTALCFEYFGMSDEECSRMHEADGGNDVSGLEVVSDHIASYTASSSTYSRDWAASCIRDAASQGSTMASFVLEDASAHDALMADVQGALMSDALAGTQYESQSSFQYIDNGTMHAVTLIFSS